MPLNFNGNAGATSSLIGSPSGDGPPYRDLWSISWWWRRIGTQTNSAGMIYTRPDVLGSVYLWWDGSFSNMRVDQSYDSGTTARQVSSTELNVWCCDCFSWDATINSNSPIWYRRNASIEQSLRSLSVVNASLGTGNIIVAPNNNFTLGGDNAFSQFAFPGQLAHIQIWNRLLNLGEFTQSMQWPGSVRNGLRGYWPMFQHGECIGNADYNCSMRDVTKHTGSGPPVTQYAQIMKSHSYKLK